MVLISRFQNTSKLLLSLCFSFFCAVGASAQVANKVVSASDISFEVPSGWKVSDKSTDQVQQFNIVPDAGNVLIIVSAYKKRVTAASDFLDLKNQVSKPRQGKIAASFSQFIEKGECVDAVGRKIPGQRISGLYGQHPTSSSSFSFVENGRFLNVLYLREDRAASLADGGWKTILSTLKVGDGNRRDKELWLLDTESGEYLNGKAIHFPKPVHSPVSSGGSVEVVVRVLIDEKGDVVWAKPVSGLQKYYPSTTQAAEKARFAPFVVCGEITKIMGTVRYRFVSR